MIRQEYLESLLSYDPETGIVTWLQNAPHYQKGQTERIGKQAGGCGTIFINGFYHQTKRLAWQLYYKRPPVSSIIVLDGDKKNLRINNLQDAGEHWQTCESCGKTASDTFFYSPIKCKKCVRASKVEPIEEPIVMPPIVRRSLGL